MQSDTAARLRSAGIGIGAVAPVAGAIAATSIAHAAAPAKTTTAPAQSSKPGPQPIVAKFKRKNVLYGGRVPVRGSLLTKQGGRRILLQVNKGQGWHTV